MRILRMMRRGYSFVRVFCLLTEVSASVPRCRVGGGGCFSPITHTVKTRNTLRQLGSLGSNYMTRITPKFSVNCACVGAAAAEAQGSSSERSVGAWTSWFHWRRRRHYCFNKARPALQTIRYKLWEPHSVSRRLSFLSSPSLRPTQQRRSHAK